MKKLLASDFDRTFYIDEKDIENNIKYVNLFRENNNIFLIATGRSYSSFKEVLNKFNFNYDYLILDHGSLIMDSKDNILYKYILDKNLLTKLIPYLKLDNVINYYYCTPQEKTKELNNKEITKIYIKYNNKEEKDKVITTIKETFKNELNIYYLSNNAIEITSSNVNKKKAIYKVLDIVKIDKQNVYTIGDGQSDIEMIKEFNGYTMVNGIKELKEYSIKELNSVSELLKELI